jgi:hypothetical protein
MDNHYHLVLRTLESNPSDAIRWLQLGRFNWSHRESGHVFQRRFKAVVLQFVKEVVEVARCIHLNSVRIRGLGLGKTDQRRANRGVQRSRRSACGSATQAVARIFLELMAGLWRRRERTPLAEHRIDLPGLWREKHLNPTLFKPSQTVSKIIQRFSSTKVPESSLAECLD